MPYSQRDLIYLKEDILLPDGKDLPHPVLIISSNRSNRYENRYTGVMMSATSSKDKFSFQCANEMFESPLPKAGCQFRTYIVLGFNESQIAKFLNRMKAIHFEMLLEEIKETVFIMDSK